MIKDKYKAWHKEQKRMLEVDSLCFSQNLIMCTYPEYDNYVWENADKFEVMKYIGLNDKNNKPIYEGDILLHNDDNWGYGGEYDKNHDGYLRTIIPNIENLLKDCPDYFTDQIQSWEIIGNIYENKELIKGV